MSRGLLIALVASILVLALGVAGLGAYVFLKPSGSAAVAETSSSKDVAKTTPLEFLKLKNFVTDLADKDRLRYIDVTIALAVVDVKALEEAKKKEPQIRAMILSQLRERTSADLAGARGKDRLAEALNGPLAALLGDVFKGIYITDLVVQ